MLGGPLATHSDCNACLGHCVGLALLAATLFANVPFLFGADALVTSAARAAGGAAADEALASGAWAALARAVGDVPAGALASATGAAALASAGAGAAALAAGAAESAWEAGLGLAALASGA